MPSPAFRPDILKLLGWENWDPLRDEAMAELARRRRIWAQNAEAQAASFEREGLCRWNGGINARGDDNNAEFNMDDEKDLGLRKLYANQDDEDGARSSDSSEDSDSSMDDEDEDQESEDSDEDGDDEDSEDDGDGDDDEDDEDEEDSSEEDDGVDKKTQLRK